MNTDKKPAGNGTEILKYRLRWDGRRYCLPAELRKRINPIWILTWDTKGLRLFEQGEWYRILEMIRQSKSSKRVTFVLRNVISPAVERDFRQRYLYVHKSLREKGGLEGKDAILTLAGCQGRLLAIDDNDSEAQEGSSEKFRYVLNVDSI